jgi:hypothetical protein
MTKARRPTLTIELLDLALGEGLIFPGHPEWPKINAELGRSPQSRHAIIIHRLPGKDLLAPGLERFAVESIFLIPSSIVLDYILGDKLAQLSEDRRSEFADSLLVRTRIFDFQGPATPERLAIISPYKSRHWAPIPFIEAVWNQGRITELSMYGFAQIPQADRVARATMLSLGMAMLSVYPSQQNSSSLVANTLSAVKKKGRPKGSGYFESQAAFLTALADVLKDAPASISVARALHQLSRHPLWRGSAPLTLEQSERKRKTLRNWLNECGFKTLADAKKHFSGTR